MNISILHSLVELHSKTVYKDSKIEIGMRVGMRVSSTVLQFLHGTIVRKLVSKLTIP